MKISRIAAITSVALFSLAACGGSESSIQSSSPQSSSPQSSLPSADSSLQSTLPPKGSRPTGENRRPCWANGQLCYPSDVGPGGGIVLAVNGGWAAQQWGTYIEVSKQTLGPDKLCDSETPRKQFWMWPGYDGIGNSYTATNDLYNVCKNGLASKAIGHRQTSTIYDPWWLNEQSGMYAKDWPIVENCCKDWRLPTLEEAKVIYQLRSKTGEKVCHTPGYLIETCEDWVIENGWYYTATPNLEPNKCEYWAINMVDGQTKSVKPNEQLRGLMVRYFGPRTTEYRLPWSPIPERSELESKTLDSLKKLFTSQFKYFPERQTPATKEGIIEELLKHPNAVKKVSCPAPATTTTVAPATTTTTTTTVAPTTTVKKVSPPTTVKKVVKKK